MPSFYSINSGNFSNGLANTIGDVSAAGTSGFMLSTTYSYPTTLATTTNDSLYGVAFQLSAVSGTPVGTIDLILSATNGSSTTVSFPISGLTQFTSNSNITPNYPVGWQLFAFDTPITYPVGISMRVGVKTSTSNSVSLIGASLANLNRSYVTTVVTTPSAGSADIIHIVGSLSSTGLITNTINYNVVSATYGNFYVHNGGILNLDSTINITMNLVGSNGLQITPNGTINIGTSSNYVLSGVTHKVNLSGGYINVHNGASFNAYGAYKTPFALLSANTNTANATYLLLTNISNWIDDISSSGNGDNVVLTPNLTSIASFDSTFIAAKTSNTSFSARTNSTFAHVSSNYIPSIVNMTRNVQISANNGYIRFLDSSSNNINNVQFKGFRNATYKGMQFATNSAGFVSLSNCAFNGDNVASTPAFSFELAKAPVTNVSIRGCSFFGYGSTTNIISLTTLSANNLTFTDNIVLSASQNGMLIDRLSSTYLNIKNNFLIGSIQNGLRVTNPYVLSGSIGGIGCMNGICGSVVAGTSVIANFDGLAGYYNIAEGVNILGTIPQLSSTVLYNLSANNNSSSGVLLSATTNNLMSPVRININGLIANNNRAEGLEAYAIVGNLSSMSFSDNLSGNIYISIGNGLMIFADITSTNTSSISAQGSNVNILSGRNFSETIFRNCNLIGNNVNAIKFNNTQFENFSMDSSVVSSNLEDVGSSSTRNLLEGSYQFNNCTFGTGILSTTLQNYQSEIFAETGFSVMKENGVTNKHYRLLRAGKISLDTTIAYGSNTVSEKLEPTSTTIKLRCGSKLIPVNKNNSYTVGVFVRKAAGYTGDSPRLMLKRNTALGYEDTVLATSVSANTNWERLSGVVPSALDQGIFEVYVDCSGASNSGSINIDNWSLN